VRYGPLEDPDNANQDEQQETSDPPFDDDLGGNNSECEAIKVWGGIGLIGSGTFSGLVGGALAAIGVGELSAGAPTIVGIFVGAHSLVVGGGMVAGGYVIFKEGIQSIMDSGCIPWVNNSSTTYP
jgi:hypothetical protein